MRAWSSGIRAFVGTMEGAKDSNSVDTSHLPMLVESKTRSTSCFRFVLIVTEAKDPLSDYYKSDFPILVVILASKQVWKSSSSLPLRRRGP